jgi:hypothetical protein
LSECHDRDTNSPHMPATHIFPCDKQRPTHRALSEGPPLSGPPCPRSRQRCYFPLGTSLFWVSTFFFFPFFFPFEERLDVAFCGIGVELPLHVSSVRSMLSCRLSITIFIYPNILDHRRNRRDGCNLRPCGHYFDRVKSTV